MIMRIRELRESASLTQLQLATEMGVKQNSVATWEKEIALPKARDLPLLAHVLGVRIDELFSPDALLIP